MLFGLAAALVSNFSRSRVWRSTVLLLASLVFLGLLAHNPIVFLPLVGFLLLGYAGLVLLERGWSKSAGLEHSGRYLRLYLAEEVHLPAGSASFLHSPYFTLGLSYIFFRVLHLLIETGDGDEKRHIGLGAYLLYTLNFTTLVSGPIQRYDEFARDSLPANRSRWDRARSVCNWSASFAASSKSTCWRMLLHAVQEDALAQMSQPLPPSLKAFCRLPAGRRISALSLLRISPATSTL